MQYVEVAAHLHQRVGSIIIGVEHQQVRIACHGITDADIVAVAAAHGVVLAAHGGEHQIVAAVGVLGECREIALGDDACLVESIGLVVGIGHFKECVEGFGAESGLRSRLVDKLSDGGLPLRGPVTVPCIDALLLHFERNEQLIGARVALHQSDTLQRVELLVEQGEVVDGLLHSTSLTGKELCLVASICLFAQQAV